MNPYDLNWSEAVLLAIVALIPLFASFAIDDARREGRLAPVVAWPMFFALRLAYMLGIMAAVEPGASWLLQAVRR